MSNEVLKHLSVSSLQTYTRCGLQWYYRYVLGKIIPPRVAQVLGKSFHQAEAENFRQKKETGTDIPTEEVLEIFSGNYDEQIKEAIVNGEDLGEMKDRGIKTLEVFHENIAKDIKPDLVEEKMTVQIADYEFLAYLDLVDETRAIRDIKTKSKSPSKNEAENSFQLTAYDLIYRRLTGATPSKLTLDCAITTKTPKTLILKSPPRTPQQLELFEEEVGLIRDAISKGVFFPAQADHWTCSEKWCGYYHICKYGKKRHKTFAMGGNGK